MALKDEDVCELNEIVLKEASLKDEVRLKNESIKISEVALT